MPLTYKLSEWLLPKSRKYEDWLISHGRLEDACILNKTIKELNAVGFYDYHYAPFEVRVACKQNYINAFMTLVQGLGCPNLEDVGYVND